MNDLKKSFCNSKNKLLTSYALFIFIIIQQQVTAGLNLNNIFNILKVKSLKVKENKSHPCSVGWAGKYSKIMFHNVIYGFSKFH